MTSRAHALVALALGLAFVPAPAIARASPPANDTFAHAVPLSLGANFAGTTMDATAEGAEPNPAGIAPRLGSCAAVNSAPDCTTSVWYTFTPQFSDTYTVETCDLGTDVDTVLAVYSGSLGSLTTVGVSDDACAGGPEGNGSRVSFSATGGTTYHVEVAGFDADQGSFYVRAYEGSPASVPEPDTLIENEDSFPSGKLGADRVPVSGPRHTPSFAFTSDTDGATFQCALDGGTFSACTSPVSLDAAPGSHAFAVRSVVSGTPDPTPAIQHFTIDNTPPDTIFTAGPLNTTSNPNVGWVVDLAERDAVPNAMSFECALDGQTPQGCDVDQTSFSGLCAGPHSFSAAGIDQADNVDPTAATQALTETGGTACASPHFGAISTASQSPTAQRINVAFPSTGEGGKMRVDYGTTAAYGLARTVDITPNAVGSSPTLLGLAPGTTYHYNVTLTMPSGTVVNGDQVFTTATLGADVLPVVALGTPVTVGHYAVSIPMTITPGGVTTNYGVLVDDDPLTPDSPEFDGLDSLSGSSPETRAVQLVDLQPGATYHVKALASDGNHNVVFSPEKTFTMPSLTVTPPVVTPPALPTVHHFRLRSSFIKVGKIKRGSKTITLVLRHLPSASSVNVTVNATLAKKARASKTTRVAKGHAKAGKSGVARVKIKLSRKARKLLHGRRAKSLALKVTVKPPGDKASSVTVRRKLAR